MAFRTSIGAIATLLSSSLNLSLLTGLNGEAGWVCLMLCNLDILFSVLVLHWATSIDRTRERGTQGVTGAGTRPPPTSSRKAQCQNIDFGSFVPPAANGTVTTNIMASRDSRSDSESLGEGGSAWPTTSLSGITVKTDHERRYSVDPEKALNAGASRGSVQTLTPLVEQGELAQQAGTRSVLHEQENLDLSDVSGLGGHPGFGAGGVAWPEVIPPTPNEGDDDGVPWPGKLQPHQRADASPV